MNEICRALILVVATWFLLLLLVLLNELLEQVVPPLVESPRPDREQPQDHIRHCHLGEVGLEVESSKKGNVDLCQLTEKPVPAMVPVRFSEDCTAHKVIGVPGQEVAQVHCPAHGGCLADLVDHEAHLCLPIMAEGVHLLGAEHVRGQELLGLPPGLTVGREGDARRAVANDVGGDGRRPRREHVVVGAQDGGGGARRRHEQGRDGTGAEEQEAAAAVLGVEVSDGYVGLLGADEVEVADDGQFARR